MSFKVIAGLFLFGIYLCSASPVPATTSAGINFEIGDDKANWEVLYNATKNNAAVGRSDDENIFDKILSINARERGSGIGRSDDHVFLFEGDIEMSKSDAVNIVQESRAGRSRRAVTSRRDNLWPKNVPYAIDRSLNDVTQNIKGAIQEWQNTLTCMGTWQDVTRTSRPDDYMYFFRGSGCYSQVGRVGGQQKVSIGNGCQQHGVVVHEIGHAMGLWHEQSRPDRDDYVTIFWDEIIPAMKFNFEKRPTRRIDSLNVSYDYDSVMHYGSKAFSSRGKKTIDSKPEPGRKLGQRVGLSPKDKQQVQLLYCETVNPTKVNPTTVNPTTLNPTTNPSCTNIQSLSNCNYWKGLGYCTHSYVPYMKQNCCQTCGSGGGVVTCRYTDKNINCPRWKTAGFCARSSRYYAYMTSNCAKSCLC